MCLLSIVALPGLLVWREMRRERLSAQLLTTLKDLQSLAYTTYNAEEDKNGRELGRLKQQVRSDEGKAVRLLQAGADPDVRDFASVKRDFWQEAKFLLKRMFRHSPASASLPRSALSFAVEADDAVIVMALLKAGANDVNAEIETPGGFNRFPLVNYGAYNGNLEIVQELCAHGADVHKLSSTSVPEVEPILQTTLEGTSRYSGSLHNFMEVSQNLERKRRTEIFHLLLAKGAKYEANSKEGYALLRAAAESDFLEVTRELLAAGVPPNARPKWLDYTPEFSPLDAASNNDDIPLVKLLLQYGALTRDPQSESPVLGLKSTEMANLLMQHGADIHAIHTRGKYSGQNALNYACIEGETKVAAFLIAQGLNPNSGGEYSSPIDQAAEYGNVETVQLLLEHGAKIGPNSPGDDALFLAIAEQRFDSARLLLRYGAAVNPKTGSPLVEAAQQDDIGMVLELLKRGANVHAGKEGTLFAACESCNEDLVELLLEHGADPTVRYNGMTAIETTKENADPLEDADGIIALLKAYGAKR